MSPAATPVALADYLASLDDATLVNLLAIRGDLATPPPAGFTVLAARASSSMSLALVGESVDVLTAAVIEVLLAADAEGTSLTAKKVVAALSGRAPESQITERLAWLRDRALVWGARSLQITGNLAAALPWQAHHATARLAALPVEQLRQLIDQLPDDERQLLGALAIGSPVGHTRDAAPDADPRRPVQQLLAKGLLLRVNDTTVEIFSPAAHLIRDEVPRAPADLSAPTLDGQPSRFAASAIDSTAGGEALELLRHCDDLLDVLGRAPAAVLRTGGLGVRELKRLAKATDMNEERVSFVLELLYAAGIIGLGQPEGRLGTDPAWGPVAAADNWRTLPPGQRWARVALPWLTDARRPWVIGSKASDGTRLAPLSDGLVGQSVPRQRRMILQALATAAPAHQVDLPELCRMLWFHYPRSLRLLSPSIVNILADEARLLGLTAHGCVSSPGRALIAELSSETPSSDAAATAMATAMPDPIDHFLLQADLTLTAPGPLEPELAQQVTLVADLESGGAASVYRISEASLRRALDAGHTSSELASMFAAHSRTPVPQGLTYLLDDVAKRHGRLRVGIANVFVRCDDPAILAEVMSSPAAAELRLRALAPTVAVTDTDLSDVLGTLQDAGFAPAGEDTDGALVDLRDRGVRIVPTRRSRPAAEPRRSPTEQQLAQVVTHIRAQAAADHATVSQASAPVRGGEAGQAMLALAQRTGRPVRIGYVDARGAATRHVGVPASFAAGVVIVTETSSGTTLHLSLPRITSVELLDR